MKKETVFVTNGLPFFGRRVHISRAAHDNLNGAFEVEPGHGAERDAFLAENNIETFLIVGKANSAKPSTQTQIQISQRSSVKSTNSNGVQHLLHNWSETGSNEEEWKPEIPFGNVSGYRDTHCGRPFFTKTHTHSSKGSFSRGNLI